MATVSETGIPQERTLRDKLKGALLTPIRAMRLRYLPLLMIYYAYGALGLVGIAQTFWVKDALTFTPAELAAIAVWLMLLYSDGGRLRPLPSQRPSGICRASSQCVMVAVMRSSGWPFAASAICA